MPTENEPVVSLQLLKAAVPLLLKLVQPQQCHQDRESQCGKAVAKGFDTVSYHSTQGRSNHCLCFKTTDSSRDRAYTSPASTASANGDGEKPQKFQEILRAVFLVEATPAQGQHCAKLLLYKLCTESPFHCHLHQISLVYLCTESFCVEDFTAAFLHPS